MREGDRAPRCKTCGSEMYMTRFQSDISPDGIHREHLYECLWREEDGGGAVADAGWKRAGESEPERPVA